jgi:hypothetical protein
MEEKKPILNFRGSNPLKTISINQHIKKQPMNENEINNQERVMARGQSPFYKFTTHNHFEIIDILDKHRVFHKIKKVDFSKMAGLTQNHFGNLSNYSSRFSVRSYAKYRNLINTLNAEIEQKPVYAPTESKPVYAPVESKPKPIYIPNPNQSHLKITLEMVKMFLNSNNGEEICINFLKSLGKYKISKSEVTTNWIEL